MCNDGWERHKDNMFDRCSTSDEEEKHLGGTPALVIHADSFSPKRNTTPGQSESLRQEFSIILKAVNAVVT